MPWLDGYSLFRKPYQYPTSGARTHSANYYCLPVIFYFPLEYFCTRNYLVLMICRHTRNWGSIKILFNFFSCNLVREARYLKTKHLVFLFGRNIVFLHYSYINFLHCIIS
jgi:hypothetical protein